MTYKIEKNVPLSKRTGRTVYPFGDMAKGDSFPVSIEGQTKEQAAETMRRLIAATQSYKRRHAVSFKIRLIPQENVIRVWRDE